MAEVTQYYCPACGTDYIVYVVGCRRCGQRIVARRTNVTLRYIAAACDTEEPRCLRQQSSKDLRPS